MCECNIWIGANEDSPVMAIPLRKFQGMDVRVDCIMYIRKLCTDMFFLYTHSHQTLNCSLSERSLRFFFIIYFLELLMQRRSAKIMRVTQ